MQNVKPTQCGMQYAVGVSAKRSTHTVGYAVVPQLAVCTQYTVGVSEKRSTHTVDLANMGGGDPYL